MSRVAPDFTALGYHHDPVDGDVASIESQVDYLRTTAARVRAAHDGLEGVLHGDHVSKQLDTILADVTAVSGKLSLVTSRYQGAAAALARYREALAPIQVHADQLARDATSNRNYDATHHDTAQSLSRQMASATDPVTHDRLQGEFDEVERRRSAARVHVQEAKDELRKLIDSRNAAAATAATDIRAAADRSGLNDTLIDHISNAIDHVKQFLMDHADLFSTIGDVLGWISLGLSVAAIFVPFLAPVALIVGGIGGAFSLVGGIGKLMKDGDWGSFALTAASSALSFLGAAKAIKGVAKIVKFGKLSLPKAMTAFGRGQGQLVNRLGHSTARLKAFLKQATGHTTPLLQRAWGGFRAATSFKAAVDAGHLVADARLLRKLSFSPQAADKAARVVDLTVTKVLPEALKRAAGLLRPEQPRPDYCTERTYMQVAAT